MAETTTTGTIALERPRKWGRFNLLAAVEIAPLTTILVAFMVLPLGLMAIVSFWTYSGFTMAPGFVLDNYLALWKPSTIGLYLTTFKFVGMTWAITLVIGFTLAYHLTFDVKRPSTVTFKFLVITIPFLTSAVIRNVAWVPVLGRNGIVNTMLLQLGLIHEPMSFLLYSQTAVEIAYVHGMTGIMMAPIFNTMTRIDKSLIEAARDAGATGFQVLRHVIVPLSLPGIAIGSIFVLTLVTGDVATVRLLGGGQIGTVAAAIGNQAALVQFPIACANAMVILAVVLACVAVITRAIDIRKEL
jgi:putative spermidine/putrescine transport system permease protein